MNLTISETALSRCCINSFAFVYLFVPCNALAANILEPIKDPTI